MQHHHYTLLIFTSLLAPLIHARPAVKSLSVAAAVRFFAWDITWDVRQNATASKCQNEWTLILVYFLKCKT